MSSENNQTKKLKCELLLLHGDFLLTSATVCSFQGMMKIGLSHTEFALGKHIFEFAALDEPTKNQKRNYKLIRRLLEFQINDAQSAADAAGIIYTHAIVDAVIYKLCKLSMSIDCNAWTSVIDKKQVVFSEVRQNNDVSAIQQKLLEAYTTHLERESLLVKCNALFKIVKPKNIRGILKGFKYSQERLESIDKLRHDLVHKLKFSGRLKQAKAKTNYLNNTGEFFINLLAKHYGVLLPPESDELTSEHPIIEGLLKHIVMEPISTMEAQCSRMKDLLNKTHRVEHPDPKRNRNVKKAKAELTSEQKELL